MHAWLYFAQIIWFIIAAKSYDSCWHPCNYCMPHLHSIAHKQYEKNKDSLWLIRCFFNVFEYAYWNMNYSYVTIHDMHFNPNQNVFILVFTNTIDPCLDTRRNWQKELEAECNRFHLQNLFLCILVFSFALLKRNLVYWQKEFVLSFLNIFQDHIINI